jgi:hypothetical protein
VKTKVKNGQASVEYILIVMSIVISSLLILKILGVSVHDAYCKIAGIFNSESCSTSFCQDEFSDLTGIQGMTGKWQVSNGQVCNSNNGGVILNTCSTTKMKATDYSVSLNNARLSKGNGYGVFFRASNAGKGINGYIFQYDPGANGFVMRKWVNGSEINPSIAYKSAPKGYDWYSKDHTLTVKVVGDTFTGYVDGVAVLTGKDSTYKAGGSGVRTWDSTNLCVGSLSVDPVAK